MKMVKRTNGERNRQAIALSGVPDPTHKAIANAFNVTVITDIKFHFIGNRKVIIGNRKNFWLRVLKAARITSGGALRDTFRLS